MVARGRFELPSAGPKPAMLVHYTRQKTASVCLLFFHRASFGFSGLLRFCIDLYLVLTFNSLAENEKIFGEAFFLT